MNTNEIKIDGKIYKLGRNLHTRLLYERMAGKILGDNMLTLEHIIFFYAVLVSFNKSVFDIEFDKFVDLLSEDEKKIEEFAAWEIAYFKSLSLLSEPPDENDKKKG